MPTSIYSRLCLRPMVWSIGILLCFSAVKAQTPVNHTADNQTPRSTPASAVTTPDPKAQAVMDHLLAWLDTYRSLTANFRYAVSQSGAKPQTGGGHILLKDRAYRLQMDRTVFVCDGQTLAVYQPDLAEATLQAYDPHQDDLNPFVWLADYDRRFRAKYIRMQNQTGEMLEVIDLIPTVPAPFQKIRLFVHHQTHELAGMELYDTQDRIYNYRISDFVYNPPFKDSDFTFDPAQYPDVMINDMR